MSDHARRRSRSHRPHPSTLDRICPDAAGIDCSAGEHMVAVPPDRDAQPVRGFGPFTADLVQLVTWLIACRVTTVAMEATGVYWIPLFELLEERGLTVRLVNARHVKNVPGRKSDVLDAEWLRDLLMVGLLRGSFRPPDAIVALRGYVRHRDTLIQQASHCIQRMQKALVQMNVLLPQVVSDITGVTGLRILRDIVAGQRDPQRLATHRHASCHATEADIVAALTGHYRPEHLLALQQNLQLFDLLHEQMAACDDAIEQHLAQITVTPTSSPLPPARRTHKPHAHEPGFDVRRALHRLTGIDLAHVDGFGPYSSLRLVAEIGTDITRWPTSQHFTSWLTLAPQNKVSGGRLLSSRTAPSANRAAGIFRLAAMAIGRTSTALGAFYRRLAARAGKAVAITATARKLAVLVYRILKGDLTYHDPGADAYEAQQRAHSIRRLQRHAAKLGLTLVNPATGELLSEAVS